jgi:uncharacterized protein (UPF0305 family)
MELWDKQKTAQETHMDEVTESIDTLKRVIENDCRRTINIVYITYYITYVSESPAPFSQPSQLSTYTSPL